MFENRVLKRIFGPERDKATRACKKKLHIDELYDLYCSPNIIPVFKIENGWVGHVAHMGRGEVSTGFWWGNLR